jgi:hypothetical protein
MIQRTPVRTCQKIVFGTSLYLPEDQISDTRRAHLRRYRVRDSLDVKVEKMMVGAE